jgi:hypothetical protein
VIRHPIHIPKTGTWSVKEGMTRGGIILVVNGHKSAADMRERIFIQTGEPALLAASVRRPDERLVSIMNHLWGGNPLVSVEEGLQQAIDAKGIEGQIWRTTQFYIDDETVLLPFEGLPILKWLGWDGPLPHMNESRKRWRLADVTDHPLWPEAIAQYDCDWPIYNSV